MLPAEMWLHPTVRMVIRFLGWFGVFFAISSLLLLGLRREKLLSLVVGFCLLGGAALAAWEDRMDDWMNPDRLAAGFQRLRDTVHPPPPPPAPAPIPTPQPQSPAAPQPDAPTATLPSSNGEPPPDWPAVRNVFAGRTTNLLDKATSRIFDGLFPGRTRQRFENLLPVHQAAIAEGLKAMMIPRVREQNSDGTLADVYFDPDGVKSWLEGQGYAFQKTQVAFGVKENFSPLDEGILHKAIEPMIRERSRFWLGDGYYTEKHRLIAEIEKMEFPIENGQSFKVSVLNVSPYFDRTRDVQVLELRVF